jgi:O-antigen/teichoic acid export membrane protein
VIDAAKLDLHRRDGTNAWWRSLLRSFLTLFLGESIARVFGLFSFVLLARRLGPAGFGLVATAMSIVGWFGIVTDEGTGLMATRDIARDPWRFHGIAERMMGLRIALAIPFTALLVGGAFALSNSTYDRDVYIRFAVAVPALALNLRWLVLGVRGARMIAFGSIAAQLVIFLGVLLLVTTSDDASRMAYISAAGELTFAVVILALLAPRYGILRPRINLPLWWATLRSGLPLMVSAFARGVLYSFDLIVITFLIDPAHSGYYATGSKPALFAIQATGLFYVSFLASYSAAHPEAANDVFRRSIRLGLGVSLPIAVALTIGAEFVVPFVVGNRYEFAAPVLAILAWKIPLSALSAPYNGVLLVRDRQLLLMRNNVAAAAVNIVGDLIATPTVGIYGVAVVSLLSTITILVLNYRATVGRGLAPSIRASF